jgi:hypothetical protein
LTKAFTLSTVLSETLTVFIMVIPPVLIFSV